MIHEIRRSRRLDFWTCRLHIVSMSCKMKTLRYNDRLIVVQRLTFDLMCHALDLQLSYTEGGKNKYP